MIEFMVLALPRSGTTWASNWLTTEATTCIHDPLFNYRHDELDSIVSQKSLGISCTALGFYADFVNKHPARKVILRRDLSEINSSLVGIGLTDMPEGSDRVMEKIDGMHVHWTDLFDKPKSIYEFLLQKPFDEERHSQLKLMEIQPNFEGLTIGKATTRKLIYDLQKILSEEV